METDMTGTTRPQRCGRRLALRIAAGLALLPLAGAAAAQASWPDRPVRIIVPFSAGGTTDVVARALAKDLGDAWGQSVVVENRAGAGGNIGADVVAKSPPDGYTLLMTSGSIFTVNPHMYAKLPFDPIKDFVPVTNVASGPQLLVVHPSVQAKNVKELIALARKPGSKLNFGSAGIGSQVHMAAESFVDAAKIEATHIPYKGENPAYTDLAGGSIQFMVGNIAAAAPFVTSGRVKALGVTSKTRSQLLPDVPTIAESGLPGFENTGWFGFMLPAGTPRAVVDKIHRDTVKALDNTEMKARLYVNGMAPVGNSPAEFAAAIAEESKLWARVVKNRGLQTN
jgi:tripartite-type tricarboxylate transporter receptor subunit TctC